MKSDTLSTVSSLCLFLCAAAPTAKSQTAPPETAITLKLDFVAWGDSIRGLRIKVGSKEMPVSAMAFEYSTPVSYNGPNILEISQSQGSSPADPYATPQAAAPEKPLDPKNPPSELEIRRRKNPNLVALAILPAGSTRATVLIAPAATGTYQTYVIDDDPTKLPLGKLRIHNYCSIAVAMRCNNKDSVELQPKQTTVIPPVNDGVIYELAYQKDGRWKMQENNVVQVLDSEQVQMVVLKSDANFFTSGDGSRGGFLQTVVLRRSKKQMDDAAAGEVQAPQ